MRPWVSAGDVFESVRVIAPAPEGKDMPSRRPRMTKVWREERKRQSRLRMQLRRGTPVTVLGVVHPFGVSGGWSQGDAAWSTRFKLEAWRVRGGPVRSEPLEVLKLGSQRGIPLLRERLKPYAVVELRARLAEDNVMATPWAMLVRVVSPAAADAELTAVARALRVPVRIRTAGIGILTLDRALGDFEARVRWCGRTVRLSVSSRGRTTPSEPAVAAARALLRAQRSWNRRIGRFAADRLLPLRNGAWRVEGELPLNAREFVDRMRLEAIIVDEDGSFSFWHDDGDLFAGHAIMVSGDLERGPVDADIPG